MNTLSVSLRDKLADAVFINDPAPRQKKLESIMTEIQKSVLSLRPGDRTAPIKAYHHDYKRHNV